MSPLFTVFFHLPYSALQFFQLFCEKIDLPRSLIQVALLSIRLIDDGLVGQQVFAGEATRLAYGTDEAQEGRDAFLEKRKQDYSNFPWYY